MFKTSITWFFNTIVVLKIHFVLNSLGCVDKVIPNNFYNSQKSRPRVLGRFSPDYHLCKDGLAQPPVNLTRASEQKLDALKIEYKDTPLLIKNNGHTIQVTYGAGSYLTVGSKKYQLLQFHFHTPSEHLKDGRSYDMEGHLVHADDYGVLGVLGVFMKAGSKENSFLKPIWENMPTTITETDISVPGVNINVSKFLPKEREYFSYAGSLTPPPCTEGVNWMVLEDTVSISQAQLDQFHAVIEFNSRPEQSLNGRTIKLMDD